MTAPIVRFDQITPAHLRMIFSDTALSFNASAGAIPEGIADMVKDLSRRIDNKTAGHDLAIVLNKIIKI